MQADIGIQVKGTPELQQVADFLQRCLPFNELGAENLGQLSKQLLVAYFKKGHVFKSIAEPSGLRILRSGAVEIRSAAGELLDHLEETDSFNIDGLAQEQPGVVATLVEDSLIYTLPALTYRHWRGEFRFIDRFFHAQRNRRLRRAVALPDDSHFMLRPVSALMSRDVLQVDVASSIQETACLMTQRRVSSAVIMGAGVLKGIVTDRDLRSRVLAEGLSVEKSISNVMTRDPFTVRADAALFDVMLQMSTQGCHHLPVVEGESLCGIVTASDLMLAKRDDPVYLVQHIGRQVDPAGIANVIKTMPDLFRGWVSSGVTAASLSHMLTAISDAVTRRLIALAEDELGPAPVTYAWLGFGSQGRNEQLLGADQDNGLLIADGVLPEQRKWFQQLAAFVCDGLDLCGYPYCHGEVMATNEQWCQPLSGWCDHVDRWTRSPTPDAVMRVSIFFDSRVIYGDRILGQKLQAHMLSKAKSNSIFLAALAANVLEHTPPIGLFRRFLLERSGEHRDSLDLKKRGVIPIIDTVRIQTLANGIAVVNTRERIDQLIEKKVVALADGRNLKDAFSFLMSLRVSHQDEQLARGELPDNFVSPKALGDLQRRYLRDAFTVVHDAQEALRINFRGGLG